MKLKQKLKVLDSKHLDALKIVIVCFHLSIYAYIQKYILTY